MGLIDLVQWLFRGPSDRERVAAEEQELDLDEEDEEEDEEDEEAPEHF